MTRTVQILATGSYVPERVVTNDEIDRLLGQPTGDWLVANVGIRERRWMSPDQTTSDLIVAASRRALDKAGLAPEQLNLIIVSTDTPDYLSPGTSVVVQHKLGALNAGAYDVNSACAGWVAALDQGARYIATDPTMNYVLVAGGYGMSRFLDLTDKKLPGPRPKAHGGVVEVSAFTDFKLHDITSGPADPNLDHESLDPARRRRGDALRHPPRRIDRL